jgi:hypothetical protein
VAFEEVDQLDDQDYYHHQFEDEGSGLVELLDHEAVEVFGGVEFFFDQVFVVGDSDFLGTEFVEAGGEHVAQELDGVVGTLGEFVDVEQDGMQFRGGAGSAPARPCPGASFFQEVVDAFQFAGEEFVVVAELEELRVRVLQQLDGGLSAGGRVVDEGSVPSDDSEVGGIVRDAGLENFLALGFGESGGFSADDLGYLVARGSQEIVGGGLSLNLADVEDEVVLLQPVVLVIGLDQGGGGALQLLADYAAGQLFEVGVGGPVGGELDQFLPVAGEGELEDQADYAVVVVLDLSGEALAGVEDQGLESFFDWGALVANVGGSFETGLGGAGSDDLTEGVEADLFADVELD